MIYEWNQVFFNLIIILPTKKKNHRKTNQLSNHLCIKYPLPITKIPTTTCIYKSTIKELFFIAEGSGTLGHGVDGLEPCPQYGGRAKLGTQLCRQPHHRQCGEG